MPRILLVEDDRIASRLIEDFLKKEGFSVSLMADGQSALAFIKSNEETPDLVMMDLMLPFVDGFELLRMIRNNPVWQKIPVIMLTTKAQEKIVSRAFESGANDFIFKPFNRQEVAQRVKKQLNLYENLN